MIDSDAKGNSMSNHDNADLTDSPSVRSGSLDTDCSSGMAQVKVFDLDAAVIRMGGNRALLMKIAEFFVSDSAQLMSELHAAIQKRDVELAHRSVHSLKGLAANFDATTCQTAAQCVEDAAAAGDLERVQSLLPRFAQELEQLNDALKTELSKSQGTSQ